MSERNQEEKDSQHWSLIEDNILLYELKDFRRHMQRARNGELVRYREEFAQRMLDTYPAFSERGKSLAGMIGHLVFLDRLLDGDYPDKELTGKYKKQEGNGVSDSRYFYGIVKKLND